MRSRAMNRRLLFAVVVVGLVAVGISNAHGQTPVTGSVSGYVNDDKERPLPGVTITIRAVDKTQEVTVTTDTNGYYSFPVLDRARTDCG